MTDFTAWAFAWAGCLALAFVAAWGITCAPDDHQGRHRAEPIRVELAGLRRPAWDRPVPPARSANTYPVCSGIRQPIPLRVISRTLPPSTPEEEPLLIHGQAHRVVVTVRTEPSVRAVQIPGPRWAPEPPSGDGVIPLWSAYEADENKAVRMRRAVAFAAALDLPDPLHWLDSITTGIPHTLAGAVA